MKDRATGLAPHATGSGIVFYEVRGFTLEERTRGGSTAGVPYERFRGRWRVLPRYDAPSMAVRARRAYPVRTGFIFNVHRRGVIRLSYSGVIKCTVVLSDVMDLHVA